MSIFFTFVDRQINSQAKTMSSDEEDEIPDLVPASEKKVPITIITGFLGKLSSISDLVPASEKKVPKESSLVFQILALVFTCKHK